MGKRGLWIIALLSLSGCGSCVRYAGCRLRRSLASCQQGPDCQAFERCAPSGQAGRCESACAPIGSECRLPSGARPDECILDVRPGHEPSCFPNGDRAPERCRLATDTKGRPTCVDANPPCAACQMTFDTCIARNHCVGIICF